MMGVYILRDKSKGAVGIHSLGYADYGNGIIDTVCTAILALELNFANSIKELMGVKSEVHLGEENGSFDFKPLGGHNGEVEFLLQSLLLGYQTVQEAYDNPYLVIKDREI